MKLIWNIFWFIVVIHAFAQFVDYCNGLYMPDRFDIGAGMVAIIILACRLFAKIED